MAETPSVVEPLKEYLGVACAHCGHAFPIVATPLDPATVPIDRPILVGASGPLHGTCPHCGHKADYTVDQLRRVRAP
jgi:DNA-directed RNA polymerase subunit RPC12/RpoP